MTAAGRGPAPAPVDLLLPVGFAIGFRLPGNDDDADVLEIRLGRDFVPVSPAEHDVWWRCRWLPLPGDLLAWARTNEIETPAATVEGLRSDGLLFHVSGASMGEFVSTHRILPLALGTGADDPESELFTIRDQNLEPLVTLDALTYMAWSMSDGYRSIGDVARDLAGTLDLDVAAVTTALVAQLPALLQVGVVSIDRAEQRR